MTDFTHRSGHRPKFLNLFKIRMPVTATVSILHRLSGIMLFVSLPFVIYGLGLSLKDANSFLQVINSFNSPLFQLLALVLLSGVFYHLLAGIRFLLLDVDVGYNLKSARSSAWAVIILAMLIIVWLAFKVDIL